MGSLGLKVEEVPMVVMCTLASGNLVLGFGLDCVYEVGKLHSVLDKEYGNVIAGNAKVSKSNEKDNKALTQQYPNYLPACRT